VIADLRKVKISIPDDVSWTKLLKHTLWALVFFPNFACVFMYRLNRKLEQKQLPFRKLLGVWRFYAFSNDISTKADIGKGLHLVHLTGIVIGGHAVIGENATILNGVTIGSKKIGSTEMPKIGSDVYIGTGAKIIGDITIGDRVTIGANAVCLISLPDDVVAYGVPVKLKTTSEE